MIKKKKVTQPRGIFVLLKSAEFLELNFLADIQRKNCFWTTLLAHLHRVTWLSCKVLTDSSKNGQKLTGLRGHASIRKQDKWTLTGACTLSNKAGFCFVSPTRCCPMGMWAMWPDFPILQGKSDVHTFYVKFPNF